MSESGKPEQEDVNRHRGAKVQVIDTDGTVHEYTHYMLITFQGVSMGENGTLGVDGTSICNLPALPLNHLAAFADQVQIESMRFNAYVLQQAIQHGADIKAVTMHINPMKTK